MVKHRKHPCQPVINTRDLVKTWQTRETIYVSLLWTWWGKLCWGWMVRNTHMIAQSVLDICKIYSWDDVSLGGRSMTPAKGRRQWVTNCHFLFFGLSLKVYRLERLVMVGQKNCSSWFHILVQVWGWLVFHTLSYIVNEWMYIMYFSCIYVHDRFLNTVPGVFLPS